MAHHASAPSAGPDRVFARAMTVVLAVWLGAALATPLALGRLDQRASRAGAVALASADRSASLRQIAGGLEDVAAAPSASELRRARMALDAEITRLGAIEALRAAETDRREDVPADFLAAARDALRRARGELAPDEARKLLDVFSTRLIPEAERLALRRASEASVTRATARLGVATALAAQLALIALLAWRVARPARRRIAAWVDASREAERRNRFRSLHDPLTNLPNAAYLQAHLAQIAAGSERAATQTAVLRVELDKVRTLRETLGQRMSDEILRISARRIRRSLRAGDFAAYLGQYSFVLVAADLEDASVAATIAHRLQATLGMPFSLQGGARRIGCTIGVALLSDDLPEPGRTLANADIALAAAQDAGAGGIHYFRESLRDKAERREARFAELLCGLERDELTPFFQPQVDLASGAFSGFEALVRWRHPRDGLLRPCAFLEFAEAADLTERIGEAVLGQTLAAMTAWDAAGLDVPRVGINFAMAQLRDPRLIEKIKWEVERHDVEPARVSIEVLETVLIKSDADLVVRNLRGLKSAGFQIELDDFGTGHASIQNLRRFMVDRIKIDRSFISGIESDAEQQTLTASMIAMARALGIETLAEGVETAAAAAMLRRLGCDHVQGYLLAEPMSRPDTFAWLAAFGARGALPRDAGRPLAGDPNTP